MGERLRKLFGRDFDAIKLREYVEDGIMPDDMDGSLSAVRMAMRAAESEVGALPITHSPSLYGPPYNAGNYTTVVPSLQFNSKRGTDAGETIKTNPLQFAPVWRLALRIGSLAIKVYDLNLDTGVRNENLRHPAYQLIRHPNKVLTRPLLVGGMVKDMLTCGAGAWYKKRDIRGGPPIELWPIPRRALIPVRDPEEIIHEFRLNVFGVEPVRIPFEDVCYFRLMPGIDDWATGMAPIGPLASVGDFGQSGIDSMTDLFDHAMLERIYVDLHGKELHPRNRNRLENQMANARQDRYGIPIMEDGATIESFGGRGPDQSIIVDAVKLATALITEAYGMPQNEEDLKFFYGETVQPIADAIEQELERSLMPEWDKSKPTSIVSFPEFAFRQVLEGDPLQRAQMHQIEALSGQKKIDEIRKDKNLPPLEDGAGDVTLVPINTRELMSMEQMNAQADAKAEAAASFISTGTPTKGSTGGFGGSQGQRTDGITAPTGKQNLANKPNAKALPPSKARSAASTSRAKALGEMRSRNIATTGSRLMGRLRAVMKRDVESIKRVLKANPAVLPSETDTRDEIQRSEVEVARHLRGYMIQIAEVAYSEGNGLFSLDALRADKPPLPLEVMQAIESRASYVASRFTSVRTKALSDLLVRAYDEDWTPERLSQEIAQRWDEITVGMAQGIANTELAYAHSEASVASWKGNGVGMVDFIFGGGPCTTHACEEIAAGGPYSIDGLGSEDIPPIHPTCGCYLVPAGLEAV